MQEATPLIALLFLFMSLPVFLVSILAATLSRRVIVPLTQLGVFMGVLFASVLITAIVIVVWLIRVGGIMGWLTAIAFIILTVLLSVNLRYFTTWVTHEQVALYIDFQLPERSQEIRRSAEKQINKADRAAVQIEQEVAKLKTDLVQLEQELSSSLAPDDVRYARIREIDRGLEKLDKAVEETSGQVNEVRMTVIRELDSFTQDLNALAERLPASFQDITQQEIRRRLNLLEKQVSNLEKAKDTKRAITLERWQLWIAVAGIVIPYVIALFGALIRFGLITIPTPLIQTPTPIPP